MACFSLGFFENLLIWLVVVGAVVAIVKLLLPYVLGPLGQAGAVIAGVLNIIIWAAVAILVIYVVFTVLSCLVGVPGLHR